MKITLTTTSFQTITVSEEQGNEIIRDWQNGDESLVEPLFDDAAPYGYQTQLHQEVDS